MKWGHRTYYAYAYEACPSGFWFYVTGILRLLSARRHVNYYANCLIKFEQLLDNFYKAHHLTYLQFNNIFLQLAWRFDNTFMLFLIVFDLLFIENVLVHYE